MPTLPQSRNRFVVGLLLVAILLSAGCAVNPPLPQEPARWIYSVAGPDQGTAGQWAPAFAVPGHDAVYNRIGGPVVRQDGDTCPEIIIDPDLPTLYVMQQSFTTDKAVYTNLIYRVHFPEVPYSLVPFNLTAGKNPGLLVVVTLNAQNLPVLVTTVHTCGCYLAMVPTRYLPKDALPVDWEEGPQEVYGEHLPSMLDFSGITAPKILVSVRPETHRIMDIAVAAAKEFASRPIQVIPMQLEPMDRLSRLPNGNGTISFYYTEGAMQGHVRGSIKPWETLLLGPLSLDPFVGSDKVFETPIGSPFYTSLKFWRRDDSDMRDFPRFLRYWGWRL
jgi:hypothetical protein